MKNLSVNKTEADEKLSLMEKGENVDSVESEIKVIDEETPLVQDKAEKNLDKIAQISIESFFKYSSSIKKNPRNTPNNRLLSVFTFLASNVITYETLDSYHDPVNPTNRLTNLAVTVAVSVVTACVSFCLTSDSLYRLCSGAPSEAEKINILKNIMNNNNYKEYMGVFLDRFFDEQDNKEKNYNWDFTKEQLENAIDNQIKKIISSYEDNENNNNTLTSIMTV